MNHFPGQRLACTVIFVLAMLTRSWSQGESGQPPPDSGGTSETSVGPGQEDEPQKMEIPPMSGNEDSSSVVASELAPTSRSSLSAGITLNQSLAIAPRIDSSNSYGTYSGTSIIGDLQLQKTSRRFKTAIDDKAGGRFFRNSAGQISSNRIQQLTLRETISGRRADLTIEDLLAAYPGGNFGAQAFGGSGAYNLGLGGGTIGGGTSNFFGFNQFGGLGQGTNITNVTLVQLTEYLTPRSSIGLGGSYGFTSYLDNANLIGSQSFSGQAGYTYQLTQRSGVSLAYGYQHWQYPGGASGLGRQNTNANTFQLGYTRQLSPRMTLGLGGGPAFIGSSRNSEFVIGPVRIPVTITTHQMDASAYASLGYSFRTSTVALWYDHLVTGGSGFFSGATSDIFQFSVSRPLMRVWAASVNAGFVRLRGIGNSSTGVFGNSYQYGFAGLAVQRALGKHLNLTASYQFNDESLSCSAGSGCPGLTQRHVALVGLSWRSLPIRLD